MNKTDTFKEKRLNFLNTAKFFCDEQWEEIEMYSKDNDEEIRKQVAELLGFHHCEKSENILVSMLNDTDCLVRAEVCDSLCFSVNDLLLKTLLDTFKNDSSVLVRGYAILAIGDILTNLNKNLDDDLKGVILNSEKNEDAWVKVAIYRTLIKTGHKKYQKKLIEKIESLSYRNRIFVISMIKDVVFDMDMCNIEFLYKKIIDLMRNEETESVLFSVRDLLVVVESILKNQSEKSNTGDGSVCSAEE